MKAVFQNNVAYESSAPVVRLVSMQYEFLFVYFFNILLFLSKILLAHKVIPEYFSDQAKDRNVFHQSRQTFFSSNKTTIPAPPTPSPPPPLVKPRVI